MIQNYSFGLAEKMMAAGFLNCIIWAKFETCQMNTL
jgi:hypothetical protein